MRPASSQKPVLDETTQASRVGRGARSLAQDLPGSAALGPRLGGGIYSALRAEETRWYLPVVIGVNARGEKRSLTIEDGAGAGSWREVLLALKRRGWTPVIGDRGTGLGALREGFPDTREQCPAEHWVHLRTTDPIESVFSTVRHGIDRTKAWVSRASLLGGYLQARPLCREEIQAAACLQPPR